MTETKTPQTDAADAVPLTAHELVENDGYLDLDELVNELTIADLEELEELSGEPIGKLLGQMNTKDLTAASIKWVVWLSLKKKAPEVTVAQAGNVKLRRLAAETVEEPATASPQ